ncbi:MAG: metalloregulator ArsR/SmtB family transcription factor [Dehalococcoidia bacterium]
MADPTRRRVLDLLAEGPRTSGELADEFTISRIAVLGHLRILEEAGLVTSAKRGRQRWNYINAAPLQDIYERWIKPHQVRWAQSLTALGRLVERDDMNDSSGIDSGRLAADIRMEVTYRAPVEAVFATLTTDVGRWWGHPYLNPLATGVALDNSLGGLFIEEWPDGGAVIARVSAVERDRRFELTGTFHMGLVVGIAEFELEAAQSETILRFRFRAIGDPDPNVAPYAANGWTDLLDSRLRSVLEESDGV